MEFFNHEQNEFSRMGSGSVIVFQGTPGPWRPKIQARSGVPAGCNGGLAA
jgi:hypothetical protein